MRGSSSLDTATGEQPKRTIGRLEIDQHAQVIANCARRIIILSIKPVQETTYQTNQSEGHVFDLDDAAGPKCREDGITRQSGRC
jgi:hypothetical protein